MLIKGIDFPEELLRAQAAGELVVFAGAGVSNPPPSSLPLFGDLAAQIGKPSGVLKEDHEPEDRYLGRLKKKGVQVHDAAARILVNEQTKPHELHRHLVQLFPTAEKVRLVTTNFDTHFTATVTELHSAKTEVFCAPALPLGDDFAGLVYLHGCAGKEPKRCVLTDEDFGRAYLAQAWASRFLGAMFSRYVVLFVGYSHNDTVMNYLARGLPPVTQKARFAFSTGDGTSLGKWEFLGIRPLIYKKSENENPHDAITISVGEWVNELKRGLLEKAQRIRSIAEAQPPLEGEDADYIRFSLGESQTAPLFFKYARLPQWISWLETNGFLKRLFGPQATSTDFDRDAALWLTEYFSAEHAVELMAAIQRNGTRIHPQLGWCIWRRLCIRDRQPIGSVFSLWIAVLLTQPHQVLAYRDWCSLLSHCRFPEDKTASVMLFDFLTRPRVVLNEPWHVFEETDNPQRIEFDLNLTRERDHWLGDAWERLFKPNLAAYANELAPIVTVNLAAAHGLLQVCGRARRDYDPFQLHRQSIEHPNEHGFENVVDVLVGAAEAIISVLLEARPQQAAALIGMWFESEAAILRRLAIFGFGRRTDVSDDGKLQWLLDNELPYLFKTDVFEFLERCYKEASDEAKRRLIARVTQGPLGERFDRLSPETKAYETYNFLVWLARIAPECQVTRAALERIEQEHRDFGPREHPELDFWSGGVRNIEPTEGFNLDEIASKPAAEFLDQLIAWRPRHPMDRTRGSYCSAASAVIAKKPEWGLEWIQALRARNLLDADLWQCVCQGWRNASLTAEQWRLVLEVAENTSEPADFFSAFAEVLESGSRKEQNKLPDHLMGQAQHVAERIWEIALKTTPPEAGDHEDWLEVAINRAGGKLAEFWLQRISAARKAAGDSWRVLPQDIAASLSEILHSSAGAAAHARIFFASQLHYFFHLDHVFAERELLPLFNWDMDALRAEQCWHGYIWWGRWVPGLTELLLPQFDETIKRLRQFSERLREHAIDHIAGLVLFRMENPLASGWLESVLRELADKDREHLAATIDRFLSDSDTSLAESIWSRWLKSYWEMRLLGTPKPLSKKEATEMVYWSLSLGTRLPEAVSLIERMADLVEFEHEELFWRLDRKGILKSQPDASADLVLFYLNRKPRYFFASEYTSNVWRGLKAGGVSERKLGQIREAMFALGHDPEQ